MKGKIELIAGLVFVGFLAACGGEAAAQLPVITVSEESVGESVPGDTANWETAKDDQGAVTLAITPVDLDEEAAVLAFEVTMDTHSVDLSMDLAALATLTTDNGHTLSATLWDAVPGGHHVSGLLTFPAVVEDTAVLSGATQLTLTITDVDAPSRTFTWTLPN